MAEITEDRLLDAKGLLCPMPVVKAGKEIRTMNLGQVLKVLATDPGAIADFPAWASDTGNELLAWHQGDDGVLVFYVKKASEEG